MRGRIALLAGVLSVACATAGFADPAHDAEMARQMAETKAAQEKDRQDRADKAAQDQADKAAEEKAEKAKESPTPAPTPK